MLQHAEAARESDLLLGGEVLVAEESDLVVEERLVYSGEGLVIERLREIHAGDLGAEVLADAVHGDHKEVPAVVEADDIVTSGRHAIKE